MMTLTIEEEGLMARLQLAEMETDMRRQIV
jgi:hypothetical protein